jgi:hypothetical protein
MFVWKRRRRVERDFIGCASGDYWRKRGRFVGVAKKRKARVGWTTRAEVVGSGRLVLDHDVVACAAIEEVDAGTADEDVVVFIAEEEVVAEAAEDDVFAGAGANA